MVPLVRGKSYRSDGVKDARRAPRFPSTASWNDSMLAAPPRSAARPAKWGQHYSDSNPCQEDAEIHQGLLVWSGDRSSLYCDGAHNSSSE